MTGVASGFAIRRLITVILTMTVTTLLLAACGQKSAPPTNTGSLSVTVDGLPAGTDADVSVSGPDGFSETVTETTVLNGLEPGEYTLVAADLTNFIVQDPATVTATVATGETATATFTYTARPSVTVAANDLELTLDASGAVTFTLTRPSGITGAVDLELTVPAGLSASATSLTFAPGADTASTTISDDGADVGTYEVDFTAEVADCDDCVPMDGSFEVTINSLATSTADSDTPGTLRHLLGDERAEVITFDPDVVSGGEFLINLTGTLTIDREVTVTGLDWSDGTSPIVILDGQTSLTPITIDTGDAAALVRLENLHVRNGLVTAAEGGEGGGIKILADSTVELHAMHITGNEALGNGGGIHNRGTLTISGDSLIISNHATNYGGGIYTRGATSRTTLDDSTVSNNEADSVGGGIYLFTGSLEIINTSNVIANRANQAGGILAGGLGASPADPMATLTILDSNISDNIAPGGGGGIYNYALALIERSTIEYNASHGNAGGVRNNRVMTIRDSTISDNTANSSYGGVFNDGYMEIIGSTISNNLATVNGGGIFNGYPGSDMLPGSVAKEMIIRDSTISGNAAVSGGGIYSVRKLTIDNTEIDDNMASNYGGGIYSISDYDPGAPDHNGGELHISNSAIHNNEAGVSGGGIFSGREIATGEPDPDAPLTIINTTIAENTARYTGGIQITGANLGDAYLFFNTIVGNEATGAPNGYGGGLYSSRPNISIKGNIIADNTATPSGNEDIFVPNGSILISSGYNFISVAAPYFTPAATDNYGTADAWPVALQLGDLQLNDGDTPTMALAETSSAAKDVPAADCGNPDGDPLTTDQRGMPRPVDGTCSAGAYQWQEP